VKKLAFVALAAAFLAGCGEGGEVGQSHPGENTYNRFCFSCHAGGVGGAPIPGDTEGWAPRIAKGREALVQSVIEGMPPGMPPMGLCMSCTNEDIEQAVDYMLSK